MKPTLIFALLTPFLMAGCVPPEQPEVGETDACGASAMQYLVGQSQDVLAAMTFMQGKLRVIEPGMPITRDLRPDRLNLDVNENGIITRVWCG